MSTASTLKREVRVALSLRAQPLWFRVLKWAIAIGVGVTLWRTPYFWWVFVGALCLSLTLHLIWRWKTKRWTQPWGGWDDLEAGRTAGEIPPGRNERDDEGAT
jgi:hypothetical protein